MPRLVAVAFSFALFNVVGWGGISIQAATTNYNWIAPSPSDYSLPANWDTGQVPNGSADCLVLVTNGGTVNYTAGDTNRVGQLQLAPGDNSSGTFNMSGGSLVVSNNGNVTPTLLGGWAPGTSKTPNQGTNSFGNFVLGGGSLTVVRGSASYQDGFVLGLATNSSGTFTVTNGTATMLCGMEIGIYGSGTVNIYGGVLIDNSWFGIGRGNGGALGSGTVNLTNGTLYLLRNTSTDGNITRSFYFCAGGTNAVANISGGTLYCEKIGFANNSNARQELLNISGGTLYIGAGGVFSSSATRQNVNISGGTFHTVDLVPNGTVLAGGYTVGQGDTNSVLADGTNWVWNVYPAVNLTASIPGMGGVGYVTFAPEPGRTITLSNAWNGNGGLTLDGPGTLVLAANNTYTGDTTIRQGMLALTGAHPVSGANIIVAGGGTLDASGLVPAFTLNSGQTLTNSSGAAAIKGNVDAGPGTLSLDYVPGTPSFTVTAGTLTLAATTRLKVNNPGPALEAGTYRLISAGPDGTVTASDNLPQVAVTGGGVAAGEYASLRISNNELYVVVTNTFAIANLVTNTVYSGSTWKISITDLANEAGWPYGDAVTLSGVDPTSADGTNVTRDTGYIYYDGVVRNDDHFNYTITDGTLTATGAVYLKVLAAGLTWPSGQLLPAFEPPATNVDCIDVSSAGGAERDLFASLEGIVNRTQPRIALVANPEEGKFTWVGIHHLSYNLADGYSVLLKYRSEVTGLVVTDPNQPDTLNLATTIAGLRNELICDPSLLQTLTNAPYYLSVGDDLRGMFSNKYQVYEYLYTNYWPQCTHRIIAGMQTNTHANLRDYLVAVKAAVVWLDPGVPADAAALAPFASGMTPVAGVYLGWWPNEGNGLAWIAQYGIPVIASDFYWNGSIFGGVATPISIPPIPPSPPLQNKVYVAFILSDGDNVQYMQHHMYHLWNNPARGSVPIGWTTQPLAVDLDPGMLNYYWSTATTNDCLVAGPSGAGYTRINFWSDLDRDAYTKASDSYLRRGGMRVITVWSSVSSAIAWSYQSNCPTVLGLTDQSGGGYTTLYGTLPAFGFPSGGVYSSDTNLLLSGITNAAAGWNGAAPMFIVTQGDAWSLGPADLETVANALDKNKYVIVRPDQLFLLYQQAAGLGNGSASPYIAAQPASQSVKAGDPAVFTVTAAGSAPLSYQWRLNGTNIAGATESSYTNSNVQPSDAGNYSVVVTNAAGNVTSSNAVLTVIAPPLKVFLSIAGWPANGSPFGLKFSGSTNAGYDVWASTNLVNWALQGAALETNPGQYLFLDESSTNLPCRFYRISVP